VVSYVEEATDNQTMVLIISVSITFGGLTLVILVMALLLIKKNLKNKKTRKNKTQIKTISIMSKKNEEDEKAMGKNEEEDGIDFDDNQEKNTLESPKPSSSEGSTRKNQTKTGKGTKKTDTKLK